jgi:hypothetical protein
LSEEPAHRQAGLARADDHDATHAQPLPDNPSAKQRLGVPGLKTAGPGIASGMRSVFVACWVIIVFGIVFYGVIGALHY